MPTLIPDFSPTVASVRGKTWKVETIARATSNNVSVGLAAYFQKAPHIRRISISHPNHDFKESCSRRPTNIWRTYLYSNPKTNIQTNVFILTGSYSLDKFRRPEKIASERDKQTASPPYRGMNPTTKILSAITSRRITTPSRGRMVPAATKKTPSPGSRSQRTHSHL